ncbi:MAG: glycoside hydrolase N-terminal domain-containing protein, partial [Butyrivibrio sp.]|nr:glycoside hydrolase N-terminal domain-containing protein [Butyrivibrio sp.]
MGNNRKRIYYDKPASEWVEALPIGNGRLGAMVFGRISEELIQMNEDSIWLGGYEDRNNKKALENLPKLRKLL